MTDNPCRMTTPIGILWTLLSIMVAGTCSFSFLQPFWFIEPDTFDSFGMYSYCIAVSKGPIRGGGGGSRSYTHTRPGEVDKSKSHVCGIYGGAFHFSNLPSNSWQVRYLTFFRNLLLLYSLFSLKNQLQLYNLETLCLFSFMWLSDFDIDTIYNVTFYIAEIFFLKKSNLRHTKKSCRWSY